MYSIEGIFKKLNAVSSKVSVRKQLNEFDTDGIDPGENTAVEDQPAESEIAEPSSISITDIMRSSFAEVKKLAADKLTLGEVEFLFEYSQERLKRKKLSQVRSLSRANTEVMQAVGHDIAVLSQSEDYDEMFGASAETYAKPGSIESMLSPAAYLTELYREAKDLHPDNSEYHLDKRRPDLASLNLSETNMNEEVSLLSLSNEVLLNGIQKATGKNYEEVMEMFASDISGSQIWDDQISATTAVKQFKETFGDTTVETFCNNEFLCKYYTVTQQELTSLLNLMITEKNQLDLFLKIISDHKRDFHKPEYIDNQLFMLSSTYDSAQSTSAIFIKRTYLDNAYQLKYLDVIPQDSGNCLLGVKVSYSKGTYTKLGTQGSSSSDLVFDQQNLDPNENYDYSVKLDEDRLVKGVTIGMTRGIEDGGYHYCSARFEMTRLCLEEVLLKLNKFIRFYKSAGISLFNLHFESARKNLLLKDPGFTAFNVATEINKLLNPVSMLAIQENITPGLYQILKEEVNAKNAVALFKKNFGHISIDMLRSKEFICRYYSITEMELNALLKSLISDKSELGLFSKILSDNERDFYNPTYGDNQLFMLSSAYGGAESTSAIYIKRTYLDNASQLNYLNVIPKDDKNCRLSVKVSYSHGINTKFGTKGAFSSDLVSDNRSLNKETNYDYSVKLDEDRLVKGVTVGLSRGESDGSIHYCSARFEMTWLCLEEVFLKLNKFIRFYKATGICFSELQDLVDAFQRNTNIDSIWINRFLYMRHYMQRYSIDMNKALVLSNANLNNTPFYDGPSAFDSLFNPLSASGKVLAADGTSFEIQFDPASMDFRQTVLKQALQVNDNELLGLLRLTCGYSFANTIVCDLSVLSALYRMRLLADVHHLTLSELSMLLSLFFAEDKRRKEFGTYNEDLEEWFIDFGLLSDNNLTKILDFLYSYTQWLVAKQWSVAEVYLMTTSNYGTDMTPEIKNFLDAFKKGIASLNTTEGYYDLKEIGEQFVTQITTAMQFESSQTAISILKWLDQIEPAGLAVGFFIIAIVSGQDVDDAIPSIVSFCQVMMQLSLIIRHVGFGDEELSLLVEQPGLLQQGMEKLGYDIVTLRNLTRFREQMNRFGTDAPKILNTLSNGQLSADQLAQTLGLNENTVSQAFQQTVGEASTLTSWDQLDIALQWLNVSAALGITPEGLAALTQLNYSTLSNSLSFGDWAVISDLLQAGLNSKESAALKAFLEEKTSAIASAYYISNISPDWVLDREKLYGYLLIDNQVTTQVKTTRLAEAISAIQLYVNRAMAEMEGTPLEEVMSRRFFMNWGQYNKHYDTWAGASLLRHYPENYIDPAHRIGQTEMFNELLQSVSQSHLNDETVEDAFKTYMTRFENIANLDVVSGYHDSINTTNGLTYFIGRSVTEGEHYYWRTLDHSQFSDGKFPANAWSEWQKIDMAISPINAVVRPVIFKSRLHIVWIEQKTITVSEKDVKKQEEKYQLKISHIKHDGSWSSPRIIDLNEWGIDNLLNKGLFCAQIHNKDILNVLFYTVQANSDASRTTAATGLFINADGSVKSIATEEVERIREYVYPQFDIKNQIRINAVYNQVISTNSSASPDSRYDEWGTDGHARLDDCKLFNISINSQDDKAFHISADANLCIAFDGKDERQRAQCNLMKRYGKMGEKFFIYNDYRIEKDYPNLPYTYYTEEYVYAVYQYSSKDTDNGRLLACCDAPFSRLDVLFADLSRLQTIYPGQVNYGFIEDNGSGDAKYHHKLALVAWEKSGSSRKSKTDFFNGYDIETGMDCKNVEITVSVGEYQKTFTADQFVAEDKRPPLSFSGMIYPFTNLNFDIPRSVFINDSAKVHVTFKAYTANGRYLGLQTCVFSISAIPSVSDNLLIINKLPSGAQFLQHGPYRIRLNTLFAQQLVTKANDGIDAVLSMDTQYLPEPSMGDGGYIQVKLPIYNANKHGKSRQAVLTFWRGREHEGVTGYYTFWSGLLTDFEQNVTLFVPLTSLHEPFYSSINFPYSRTGGLDVYLTCESGRMAIGKLTTTYENGHLLLTGFTVTDNPAAQVSVLQGYTEPMDFSEANALYFWEMFYYAPMMLFKRFLQEQRFGEAAHWLKYIWSPEGYYIDGKRMDYNWNCRPLMEDISWNADPENLDDPDAIAQHDPMHYKLATFMGMIDLLLARGDSCYRQLERDTLTEAKMWYVQARALLGKKSVTIEDTEWQDPQLDEAAVSTRSSISPGGNLSAQLFLPQQNEKISGYWQLIEQRLYNLRHNLSIDGQLLSLSIYAKPADPALLHNSAVNSHDNISDLPRAMLSLYRFPALLESAKGMVNQLMQFGSSLLSMTERQDAEALAELLQTQGIDLSKQSISIQEKAIAEIDADKKALLQSRSGAQSRLESYRKLYDENINAGEKRAMDLYKKASAEALAGTALHTAAATADLLPNIFGLADGGCRWGAAFDAMALGTNIAAGAMRIDADKISQSEAYRRRRQEWEIQRNAAESEVKQIDAQLEALAIHREAAVLQKALLETQHTQSQAQLTFLRKKVSNKALYQRLRSRLAFIYDTFYDLSASRCRMAERAWQWHFADSTESFIRPANGGFLAGEGLMLNLAQMEKAYLEKDRRALEVTRTVSLAEFYAELPKENAFIFAEQTLKLLTDGKGEAGTDSNTLTLTDSQLIASVKLSDLKINSDYPENLGGVRRIKQISVTLPALIGPYEDVRAVLGYGGSVAMPQGCNAVAISHGMNDSGQFQLDFNDPRYLPFEGIPVDDSGNLSLSFPEAADAQKTLLQSLSDIILHIRYTIQS